MEGEIAAMSETYKYMPSFPLKLYKYAWGQFSVSPPHIYSLLMEHLDVGMDMV